MAREVVNLVKAGHRESAYAKLPVFMDLCSERWEHENKKAHVLSGMAFDALRQDHAEWALKFLNASQDRLERARLLPTMIDERRSVHALIQHVLRGGSLETCPRLPRVNKLAFVCPDNAVLSPMAEAFAAHEGGDLLHAISGGVNPAQEMLPLTLRVLSEVGLDLMGQRPKGIPPEVLERYHMVVGINASREEVLLGSKRGRFRESRVTVDHLKGLRKFRQARDAVHRLVSGQLADMGLRFMNEPEQ